MSEASSDAPVRRSRVSSSQSSATASRPVPIAARTNAAHTPSPPSRVRYSAMNAPAEK